MTVPRDYFDTSESRAGLSGALLTTQLPSHMVPPGPKEGMVTLFFFLISPWKPLSYIVKNASLAKVTRAGNFPLAGDLLPGSPCASTNQGHSGDSRSADGPCRALLSLIFAVLLFAIYPN